MFTGGSEQGRQHKLARTSPTEPRGFFARAAASLAAMALLGGGAVIAMPALPEAIRPPAPAAHAVDPSDLVCDYAAGDTGSYASSICWINFKNITLTTVPTPVVVPLAGGASIEFDVSIDGRQTVASSVPSYWGANFGLYSYLLPRDRNVQGSVSYIRPAIYQIGPGSSMDTTVNITNIRAYDPDRSLVTRGYSFVTADAEATNGDGTDENTNAENISWSTNTGSIFKLISDRGEGYGEDEACSGQFLGEYTNSIFCKGKGTGTPKGAVVLSVNAPSTLQAVLHAPQQDNKQAVAFGVMPSTITANKEVTSLYNSTDSFSVEVATSGGKTLKTETSTPGARFVSTDEVKVLAALDGRDEYIFTEKAGPNTDLNNYTTSYSCTNTYYPPGSKYPTITTPSVTRISDTSVRVVVNTGDDVDCTFTNTAKEKPPSLAFTKSVSKSSGVVNDTFTYTIRATNNDADSDLNGLTITDTVPDGLQIQSVSSGGQISGQRVTWANQAIAGGGEREYQITVKALQPGQFVNRATADSPNGCTSTTSADGKCWASATVNIASGLNLRVVKKVTSLATVKPGDPVTYSIEVQNTNSQPTQQDQTVTDQIPDALENVSLLDTDPNVALRGNQLTWTIPAGTSTSQTITIQGTVKKTQPAGAVTNTASLSGACDSAATPDACTSSATFTVAGSVPNIEVTKSGQASVRKGTEMSYSITAANSGQLATTRTNTVVDMLPNEIDWNTVSLTATPSGSATFDKATGQVTWTLPAGMLPAALGGSYQLSITGTVLPTTTSSSMSNTAGLQPSQDCTTKCSSTVDTAINSSAAAITLAKSANPANGVRPGGSVVYSLVVTNSGTGDLRNITVSDKKLTDPVVCPAGGNTIASLAQGASQTCTVTHQFTAAEVAAGGPAWGTSGYTNTASASGFDTNNVPVASNDATATTKFAVSTDTTITKKATAPNPAHAGDTVSYEVTIRYDGDGDLKNVVLNDPMLPGLANNCQPALTGTISKGFSTTCTGSKLLTEQDIRDHLEAGKIPNTATITGTSALWPSQSVNESASADVTLDQATPRVLLTGTKVVDPTAADPGDTVRYTIKVKNEGQLTATDVTISDVFSGAGTAPFDSATCAWPTPAAPGTLKSGEEVTCSYPYTIVAGDADRTVHNVAMARAKDGTKDVGPVEIGKADVAVSTGVDLSLAKKNDSAATRIKPGAAFNYTITATNKGEAKASNVVVVDKLPDHLTPVTAGLTGWTWDPTARTMTSVGKDVPGLGTTDFTFPVTLDAQAPGETVLENVAAIEGMATPAECLASRTKKGCAFDTSLTIDDAAVTIEKSNNVTPRADKTRVVKVGETFDYTVIVKNSGKSAASGIVVTDKLPTGLEFVSTTSTDWVSVTKDTATSKTFTVPGESQVTLASLKVTVTKDAPLGTKLLNVVALPTTPIDECVTNPNKTGCGKDPDPPIVPDNSKVTIKKVNDVAGTPKLVRAGESYTYTITVKNTGTKTAHAVQVSDTIDTSKLTFDPAAQSSVWSINGATFSLKNPIDLEPGEQQLFDIVVQVKNGASGVIDNIALRDATDPATCAATPTADGCGKDPEPPSVDNSTMSLTKSSQFSAPGALVKPGQEFSYTLTAKNDGTGPAANVQVVDQIPDGVDFYPAAQPGWTLVKGQGEPGTIIRQTTPLASLPAGEEKDFTFTVRVRTDAKADSTIRNVGTVGPTDIAGCVGNSSLAGCAEDKNKPKVDASKLEITKTNNVTTTGRYVQLGDTFRYTIELNNTGASDALGVVVADQLPEGLQFAQVPQSGWATLDQDTRTATSSAINVPKNSTILVNLDVKVVSPAKAGDVLTNVAANTSVVPLASCLADSTQTLTGCAWDANPVTITDHSGVEISKVNNVATEGKKVRVGDSYTYRITVKNTADRPAYGVQVSDTIDQTKLTLADSQSSLWKQVGATLSLIQPIDLAKNEERTFDIAVVVKQGASGTIDNVAVLDDTAPSQCVTTKPSPGCGPDLDPPKVDNSDVSITKSNDVDGNRVRAGGTFTYTFAAQNKGTDDATISITDLLPAGLNLVPASQTGWKSLGINRRIQSEPLTVGAGKTVHLDLIVQVAPGTAPLTEIRNAGSIDGTTDVADCLRTPTAKGCAVDETLIVDDSDLSITKKNSFPEGTQAYVAKDESFSYTLHVANPGSLSLDKVRVADQLPAGLVLDGQQDTSMWSSAQAGGRQATSVELTVPAKGSVDLTLKVKSDGSAAIGDTLTNVAAITTKVSLADCVADQTQKKPYCAWDTAGPKATDLSGITVSKANDLPVAPGGKEPRVVIGQQFNYLITVTNTKPFPARGVVATDYLPDGLTAIQPLPAGWNLKGNSLVSDPFDMAAGAAPKVFTIPVKVADGAVGVLRNVVVKGNDPIPNCTTDPSLPGCDPKPPRVDTVQLTKVASPARVHTDGTVTYTFTARNTGTEDVPNYRIIDSIPQYTSLDPNPQPPEWTISKGSGDGGTIVQTTTPFTVPRGGVVTKTLTVKVAGDARANDRLENVATMEGGRTPIDQCVSDPDKPDCVSDSIRPIVDNSAVTLEKTNDVTSPGGTYPRLVKRGDSFSYSITASNATDSDAENTVIVDRLPDGLAFDGSQGEKWGAPNGQEITSVPFTIPAKKSVTLTLTVKVTSTATGVLTNVSAVSGTRTIAECTATPTLTGCGVDQVPVKVDNTDIVTTKKPSIGDNDEVRPGQKFSYTLVVKNNGTEQATGVKIVDLLPAGLQLDPGHAQSSVWSYNASSRLLTSVNGFNLPGNGGEQSLIVYVQVRPDAKPGSTIHNVGTINTDEKPGTDPPTCETDATLPGCFEEPGDHEVNDSAIELTKKNSLSDPYRVLRGQAFSYTITAKNTGTSSAKGVKVTDQLPAGLVFEPTKQDGWTITGTRAVSDAVDIEGGKSHAFTLLVKVAPDAVIGSTLTNVAALNSTSTPEQCLADKTRAGCAFDDSAPTVTDHSAVKPTKANDLPAPAVGELPRVKPGETFSYRIEAFNDQAFDAIGVKLADTLPSGLELAGTQDSRWIITNGNRTLSYITDMKPGERITLMVKVRVTDDAEGTLRNALVIDDAPPPDCVKDPTLPGCDPKPPYVDTVTPSKVSNLEDFARVRPGDPVTYTFKATNSGSKDVSPYGFIDQVPAGLTLDRANLTGWRIVSGDGSAGTIVRSDPTFTVPGKDTVSRLLAMKVADDAADGTLIHDVGTVINGTTPIETCVTNPKLPDCYEEETEHPVDRSDVTLVKTNSVEQSRKLVKVGDRFSYTIVARNAAPKSAAKDVQITDRLPAYLDFDGAQDPNVWQLPDKATRTIQSTKLTIPANGEVRLTLKVIVLPGASGELVNASAVDGKVTPEQCLQNPNLSGCGVDREPVNVDNTAISAAKTASVGDGAPVRAGQEFSYEIVATNAGSQAAKGVTVSDKLPAQLELIPNADFPRPASAKNVVVSAPFDLAARAPGAANTKTLTLKVKVKDDAAAGTTIHNIGSIIKPEDDGPSIEQCVADPSLPQCFEETGDHTVDDSSITVTKRNLLDGNPPYVKKGDTYRYALVVKNNGSERDAKVSVSDLLPTGLSFDPAEQSGWKITGSKAVSTTFALEGYSETTLYLSVKVDGGVDPGTRLKNVSAADGTTSGGTPVEECVSDPTKPGCGPDPKPPVYTDSSAVKFTKVNSLGEDKPVVTIGQSYSYTITATNTNKELPAKQVEVSDTLPSGLAFDSIPKGWQTDSAGKAWIVTDVEPGQTLTWTLGVKVMPGAKGLLYNVVVKDGETPSKCDVPNPPPECDPKPPEVDPSNVSIAKSSELGKGAKVKPDQVFEYTLTATNTGEGPATNRTFSDTLPAGLEPFGLDELVWNWDSATRKLTSVNAYTIAAGESKKLAFKVTVLASNTPGAEIVNTGCVVFRGTDKCAKDPDPPVFDNSKVLLEKVNDTAKWDHKVRIGDTFTYSIKATNTGDVAAENVQIFDRLPLGLAFQPAGSQPGWATVTATTATSPKLTIDPKSSVTLALTVVVTKDAVKDAKLVNVSVVDGKVNPPTCETNPKLDGCGVDPKPPTVIDLDDVKIEKISDKPKQVVVAGDELEYTIKVTNETGFVAHDVPVSDTLPAGLEFSPATQEPWTIKGQVASMTIGSMSKGEVVRLTLRAKVSANAPAGKLWNVSVIGDRDPKDCIRNPEMPRCGRDPEPPEVNPTKISLAKANDLGDATTVLPGQVFNYTIKATNAGGAGGPVKIFDRLPDGLEFYPTSQAGWVIDTAKGTSTTVISTIGAGETKSVTLSVRVKADAKHGTQIKNAAMVYDPRVPDNPPPIDRCIENPTLPECGVDPNPPKVNAKVMQIEKKNDLRPTELIVNRGRVFNYTITVRNIGLFDATGVTVKDRLPDGLAWASTTQAQWAAIGGKDATSAPFTVPAKNEVPLTIQVVATKTSTTKLRNVVALTSFALPAQNPQVSGGSGTSVSEPTADAVTIEQCVSDPNKPGCAFDDVAGNGQRDGVSIVKSHDAATGIVKRGQTFTYTLTVKNDSDAPSSQIAVSDRLPAGLEFAAQQDPVWQISDDRLVATLKSPIDVDAGKSRSFVLKATVTKDATGLLRNVAVMDERNPDDCIVNPALPGCGVDPRPPVVDPGAAKLQLVKKAATVDKNKNGVMDLGDTVSYSFEVTNSGDKATDSGIEIIDPMLQAAGIAIICPQAEIAPGATITCAASAPYVLTKGDQQAGKVRNVAVAAIGDTTSRPAEFTVTTSGKCDGNCPTPLPTTAVDPTDRLPYTGVEIAATLLAALLLAAGGLIAYALGRRRRRGDLA